MASTQQDEAPPEPFELGNSEPSEGQHTGRAGCPPVQVASGRPVSDAVMPPIFAGELYQVAALMPCLLQSICFAVPCDLVAFLFRRVREDQIITHPAAS